MSREVEYGIRVTAKDELSAPVARAETSVRKLDAAIDGATSKTVSFAPALKNAGEAAFSLSGALGALGAVGAGLFVFGAAAEVTRRFAGAMMDAAAAASEAEQAERRAIATIRLHGEFGDRQFEALKRNNLERQRQLGIDADLQAQMQGTLSAMGVQAGALDRATQAAIGLSRATGLGLTEASRAVAKALGGHVESLREYGIRVDSVAEAEARMADMFRASQAQSGTYGVAVSALSAAWGDLIEAFGALITQNPQVMTTIQSIIGGVESMTDSMGQGTKTARGLGQIVTTTFRLIGTGAQATASLISNMIGALNFVWRSPNLMRLSKDLDKSIVEMQNIMSGGTGREASTITQAAAAEYLEAFKAAEFYRRELQNIDPAQEGAADAIMATNAALAEQEGKLRALQEWASKSTLGMRGLISAAEELAQAEVDAAAERNRPQVAKIAAPKQTRATTRTEAMGPPRELFEAYEREQKAIDKLFAEADAAKARANERAIEREREAAKKIADARAQVEQRALEAERARIAEYAGFWRDALSQVTDLFGNAWSTIGKLQTKTTTEIVRNEKGMLEERTVMTEQYIGTVGTALAQFLGDAASMFARAALNYIATKAVEAAAGMISSAIGTLGLAGLLIAPAAAAVAMGLVSATKSQVPPPPKFFTGGRVPGPLGAPRVAVVEGGERVVSIADSIDQRGSRGGSVVVQQQLLVAPSRVSMERANRDSILPALRRMQRLGMAT